jgi:hypothetical protein
MPQVDASYTMAETGRSSQLYWSYYT